MQRHTFIATVEVTAVVPPGTDYTSEDFANDIRDTVFLAVTEETPLDAIIMTVSPVNDLTKE